MAFLPLLTATLLACTPEKETTTDSSTGDTTTDGGSTAGSTSDSTGATSGASTGTTDATTDATTSAATTDATTSTTDATTSAATSDATTGISTDAPVEDCAFLVFKLFESDDELECGLGPNGVELCHWTISFTADAYEHQYSDIGEQGTYTCQGGVIMAIDGGQNPHNGTIDADTGALVWDGVAYHVFL